MAWEGCAHPTLGKDLSLRILPGPSSMCSSPNTAVAACKASEQAWYCREMERTAQSSEYILSRNYFIFKMEKGNSYSSGWENHECCRRSSSEVKGYELPSGVVDSVPSRMCLHWGTQFWQPVERYFEQHSLNLSTRYSAKPSLKVWRGEPNSFCVTVLPKGCEQVETCFPQILLNKKEAQPLEDRTKVDSIWKNVLTYVQNQMKNSRNEEQRTPKRDCRQPITNSLQHSCKDQYNSVLNAHMHLERVQTGHFNS